MQSSSNPQPVEVIGVLPLNLTADGLPAPSGFLDRQRRHKSNPRTADYLKTCFGQFFPQGKILSHKEVTKDLIQNSDVVLLYPDAIGQGCKKLEQELLRLHPKSLRALTGRKRLLTLDSATLNRLGKKRIQEQYFLGEVVWGFKLLCLSPFWVISDLLRGHR